MFEYLQRTNLPETLAEFQAVDYKTFELTADGPSEVQGFVRPCVSERNFPDVALRPRPTRSSSRWQSGR